MELNLIEMLKEIEPNSLHSCYIKCPHIQKIILCLKLLLESCNGGICHTSGKDGHLCDDHYELVCRLLSLE